MNPIRSLVVFFLVVLFVAGYSQVSPGPVYGGSDNEIGYAISATPDGGYLLVGSNRSHAVGSWDGYAVKIKGWGAHQWSQTYGWLHHDHFQSVKALGDGYLFLGHIWDFGEDRLDIYLMRTDLVGYRLFDNLYGTNLQDLGFKVEQSVTGGYLILGYTRGYEPHGDIFLIKTDPNGNEIWRNHYGTTYDEYAYSFIEKGDGSIIIFGSSGSYHHDVHYSFKTPSANWIIIEVDDAGKETDFIEFETEGHDFARSILADEDGGYYLFGSSQSYGAGSFDMLLMKVDADWNELWHKTFGGPEYEYGMSMDMNEEGDLYLCGSTKSFGQDGSPDYYLVKVNDEGDELWSITTGGEDIDYGNGLIATGDGGCAMIGQTKSFGSGGFDMLMVKVSKDGIIEDLLTDIDSSELDNLVVYPNPVRGQGRIMTSENNVSYQMDIVTINGSVVKSLQIHSPDYGFNVETLPSGTYVYRITTPANKDFLLSGKLMVR